MGKILGLDVGVGSLGWAVIDDEEKRIVDLGVRIFESGEEGAKKAADRASQKRRSQRAIKRLNKRNKQRKIALKKFLEQEGIVSCDDLNEYYRTKGNNPDVWAYRDKALRSKLTPYELASILINMANYRGYKDFYADSDESVPTGVLNEAKNRINNLFSENKDKYETIGQMIYKDPAFRNPKNGEIIIRNRARDGKTDYKYLIDRQYLVEETRIILNRQRDYGYEQLSADKIDECIKIIFHQRDFEDGPGPNKITSPDRREAMLQNSNGQQKYSGFDELIGVCPFYPTENRCHKSSLIYDLYVLINDLSQFRFYRDGVEINLPRTIVLSIFNSFFDSEGVYTIKSLKQLCEKEGIEILLPGELKSKKQLSKAKYIAFLSSDLYFTDSFKNRFREEDPFDTNSLSSQIGYVLAKYATPSRRKDELKQILSKDEFEEINYARSIKIYKSLGVASVSAKYMLEAINAYFDGEKYGDFQARINKSKEDIDLNLIDDDGRIIPIKDPDIIRNPVVCRTLNETRKIVNAVRKQYKGISTINIEVAKEVGQSFEQRKETAKYQKENEKNNELMRNKLIEKLTAEGLSVAISPKLMEKYTLWELQNHKCMYSGRDISFAQLNSSVQLQVDHIIPQSIVPDETLNNKALVFTEENQKKGNKVPLQYMTKEQADDYKNRVMNLYRNGKISRTKKEYLLLEDLDNSEVISGFVDRNLNDTRTISKYISIYLTKALSKDDVKIQVIKGSVTSRFRQRWLGTKSAKYPLPSIYGLEKKTRDLHYYHHAIDAAVVANLTRPYIEIAQDYVKLLNMKRDHQRLCKEGNSKTASYLFNDIETERRKTIEKMKSVYGFNPDYTERLLNAGYVPSICNNFREEIEVRVPLKIDMDMRAYDEMFSNFKELRILLNAVQLNMKDTEALDTEDVSVIANTIPDGILEDINEKIGTVCPNVVCLKPNAEIVYEDSNPDEIKSSEQIQKDFDEFCKKFSERDIAEYINDVSMLTQEEYTERLTGFYGDKEFEQSIKIPYVSFKVSRKFRGNVAASENPVSLKETGFTKYIELEEDMKNNLKCRYYVRFNKGIGENGNFTIYDARTYYCMEIYTDEKGKYQIRGIRYVDVRKDNNSKKLILMKSLPEGCEHKLYIFKNEYIRVFKKGKLINNGFGAYRGVENINQNTGKIRMYANTNLKKRDVVIHLNFECKKYEISLLGHEIGEVKCGDQSLFTTVKK